MYITKTLLKETSKINRRTFVLKDLPQIQKLRENMGLPNDENFKSSLPVVSETMEDSQIKEKADPSLEEMNRTRNWIAENFTNYMTFDHDAKQIRQSGPKPPIQGPWNIEDVRKVKGNMRYHDYVEASTSLEELKRRVPGLSSDEQDEIRSIGLTPHEELDLAYLCKNFGFDVFFVANEHTIGRQVTENAKGEKVEILFPFCEQERQQLTETPQEWDEVHQPIMVQQTNPDLEVPNTFFEQEWLEEWGQATIKTQTNIPERFRKPAGPGLPERLKVKQQKEDQDEAL